MAKEPFRKWLSKARASADYQAWRHAGKLVADPHSSGVYRRIAARIELPTLPRRRRLQGSVWGVAVVKNEADVIVDVTEHLLRQGLDAMLVADNLSTDETPLLLADVGKSYPVHIARDGEVGHYHGVKMTILCDVARRSGADWIVPFDADEFWFASTGTVGEFLRGSNSAQVRALMYNLYPVPGTGFREGAWRLDRHPHNLQKTAFRSYRNAAVGQGNHEVRRPGSCSVGLRLIHVPWRSYYQFRQKTVQGAEAYSCTDLDAGLGAHKRALGNLDDQAARGVWERIVRGEPVEGACWSPGRSAVIVDPLRWATWDPDGLLSGIAQ